MRIDFNIMNNFLNWTNFKFQLNVCYKFQNRFKFESYMNFKGFKPCGKNLVNPPKIYLDLIFTTMNLVWYTCMQDLGVLIQVSKQLDLKIRKEFQFEIQTTQHLYYKPIILGFYSSFQMT
jgi:hypothetical protein